MSQFFTWRRLCDEKPMIGTRFVAVYADKSSANLFLRLPDGRCKESSDGEIYDEDNLYEYDQWAYLPSDSKLWFEVNG